MAVAACCCAVAACCCAVACCCCAVAACCCDVAAVFAASPRLHEPWCAAPRRPPIAASGAHPRWRGLRRGSNPSERRARRPPGKASAARSRRRAPSGLGSLHGDPWASARKEVDLGRAGRRREGEGLASNVGCRFHCVTVTANCGALTTSRVVITNLRGSGCSPCWIQICKSTCGARNARWSQRTPSMTALPTTKPSVTSSIRISYAFLAMMSPAGATMSSFVRAKSSMPSSVSGAATWE